MAFAKNAKGRATRPAPKTTLDQFLCETACRLTSRICSSGESE